MNMQKCKSSCFQFLRTIERVAKFAALEKKKLYGSVSGTILHVVIAGKLICKQCRSFWTLNVIYSIVCGRIKGAETIMCTMLRIYNQLCHVKAHLTETLQEKCVYGQFCIFFAQIYPELTTKICDVE